MVPAGSCLRTETSRTPLGEAGVHARIPHERLNAESTSMTNKNLSVADGFHGAPRLGRRVLAAAALAAAGLASAPTHAFEPPSRLEGTWRVTRHGVDCQTGQQLSTFMAITTFAHGGTASGFGVPPGSSPALGSPEYGEWKREGGPDYSFRLLSYAYDASGTFAGSAEVTGQLVLARGAEDFTYTSHVAFFDALGNPLFTVCGAASGVRF